MSTCTCWFRLYRNKTETVLFQSSIHLKRNDLKLTHANWNAPANQIALFYNSSAINVKNSASADLLKCFVTDVCGTERKQRQNCFMKQLSFVYFVCPALETKKRSRALRGNVEPGTNIGWTQQIMISVWWACRLQCFLHATASLPFVMYGNQLLSKVIL